MASGLLTSVELEMILALPEADIGLMLADYSLDWYTELQAGPVTAEDFEVLREQYGQLCAGYSLKFCGRISNARRTHALLPAGDRLKDPVWQEIEGLQQLHGRMCGLHWQQWQCLARFEPNKA